MNNMNLSDEEKLVLTKLAEAWNAFCRLPALHSDDAHEFRHAIHACQNIIFARPKVGQWVGEIDEQLKHKMGLP